MSHGSGCTGRFFALIRGQTPTVELDCPDFKATEGSLYDIGMRRLASVGEQFHEYGKRGFYSGFAVLALLLIG